MPQFSYQWPLASVKVALFLGLASAITAQSLSAEDWLQFRGNNSNGIATNANIPASWSSNENIAWEQEISGQGWSSPIVVGDEIFLTSATSPSDKKPVGFGPGVASMRSRPGKPTEEFKFELICLSLKDGKIKWRTEIDKKIPKYSVHPSNTYATESPTSDGNLIYAYFATTGEIACVSKSGKIQWKKNFGSYSTGNNFGTASSLVTDGTRVYLQCDNDEKSFLICLDGKTGNEIWKKDRSGRTCWSSPMVWKNKVRTELVVCGSNGVQSFDPKTGKEYWNVGSLGGSFSSSPACDESRIYFGNSGPGRAGPLVAISAGASGDLKLAEKSKGIAWAKNNSGPGMPSPVAFDGKLYVLGRGTLTCYDGASGKRVYRGRLESGSSLAASPFIANGLLYITDEDGNTSVVQTGDEFKVVQNNSIPGLFWSTPSISGDSILLREAKKLICIRK